MKTSNKIKSTLTLLLFLLFLINSNAQVTISTVDFDVLDNTNWEGTLTYLDYQSNKPTDVATTMQIKIIENTIEQNIQYVWEPDKNVKAKTTIKKNGKFFGKQEVISKLVRSDGSILVTTTAKGRDDGKKATFYFTYEFDKDNYKVIKEVQFLNSKERFMRNTYKYKRIK